MALHKTFQHRRTLLAAGLGALALPSRSFAQTEWPKAGPVKLPYVSPTLTLRICFTPEVCEQTFSPPSGRHTTTGASTQSAVTVICPSA